MKKPKVILLVVIAAALAATAASWKWHGHTPMSSSPQYKIAGWTWGDSAVLVSGRSQGQNADNNAQ